MVMRLDAMFAALTRRPEDACGIHRSPETGVQIAWIEGAGSHAGVRPTWNEARDVCLFLHGEVFTDADTLEGLRRRGHSFANTGAEHVVHLYEEQGPAFVEVLNGGVSGLLIDLRRRTAMLFNDRFGIGRIYVADCSGGLAFASEAKALLRAFPDTRRLDMTALGESFSYGCVLRNRTLFQGVSILPPASRWSFDRSLAIKKECYFDRRTWEAQEPLPEGEFQEQLTSTFAALLPRYLQGPGVGMSLTGGLDGRMIMAWARAAPGTLPCYSFVGPYRECHDVRIARQIAQACGQPHHIIAVGDEMLRSFPDLAAQCVRVSDGTMDVSGAVELYVNRAARAIAPIRLTGNYGSEIVRCNVAFRPQRLRLEIYDSSFVGQVSAANELYMAERRGGDLSFIAFKQVPWYHHARASVERSQIQVRSPFLDNALVALMYRAPLRTMESRDASLGLIQGGNPRLAQIPTDRGFRNGPLTLADRLTQAVRDFSAKAEYAYDYGMPTWLTKVDRVLSPLRLERLFLGRHKFYHFRTWYRRELSAYVQEILLSPSSCARNLYRDGALARMVHEHVHGIDNHTDEIHRALTYELIHLELLEPDGLRREMAGLSMSA